MRPLGDVAILLHRGRSPGEGLPAAELRRIASWTEDVLKKLARLHESGAYHGNVGPDTVRIGPRGARLAGVTEAEAPPEYRDPERERLRIRDARTALVAEPRHDLYGVGAVLFTLLDGGPPTCGHASACTRPVPPALAFVTARAMAEGPGRYPDADSMRKDLERFRRLARDRDPASIRPEELPSWSGGDVRPVSTLAPFVVRRRREGRWLRLLFVAGLVLTLAGLLRPRGGDEREPGTAVAVVRAEAAPKGLRGLLGEWRTELDERLRATGHELDPVEVPLLVVGDAAPDGDLGWPRHPSRTLAREVEAVLAAGGGAAEVRAALLARVAPDTLPAVLRVTAGSRPGRLHARLYYAGIVREGEVPEQESRFGRSLDLGQ